MIVITLADGRPRGLASIMETMDLRRGDAIRSLGKLIQGGIVAKTRGRAGDRRLSSFSLSSSSIQLARQLLVVQANVDLDFGVLNKELDQIRTTVVGLARLISSMRLDASTRVLQ